VAFDGSPSGEYDRPMEPERFDDVESRILEGPEPPRRRPAARRRWAVAGAAAVLAAGGLSAGASALSGSGDEPAAKAKRPAVTRNADGIPFVRSGPECRAGEHKRRHRSRESARSQSPRY
jgi:hypothetical protein